MDAGRLTLTTSLIAHGGDGAPAPACEGGGGGGGGGGQVILSAAAFQGPRPQIRLSGGKGGGGQGCGRRGGDGGAGQAELYLPLPDEDGAICKGDFDDPVVELIGRAGSVLAVFVNGQRRELSCDGQGLASLPLEETAEVCVWAGGRPGGCVQRFVP